MRRSGFFWGGALVLLGILFLLDNMGVIDINIWTVFWPLLLIGLGVSLLLDNMLGSDADAEEVTIPLLDASKARIKLKHGAGRLQLGSGASASTLLEGDFEGGVRYESRKEGATLNVQLQPRDGIFAFPFFGWGKQGLAWNVSLNEGVVLALDLETGANESDLDLSSLLVSDLRVQTGASSARVRLPAAAGYTRADIRSGVSSVQVEVPEGVAAMIRASGGLATVDIDEERFPRAGAKRFRSVDYETAANRVEIHVETGVGSIRIV